MKYLLSVVLLLLVSTTTTVYGYGEIDSDGNPNWFERESLTLANALRISPVAYKVHFMPTSIYSNLDAILTPSNFSSSVAPVYYNNTWNRLAKAHSYDMAVNNCFSHDDCNKTKSDTRVQYYLGGCTPNARAENIAYGTPTGIETNNLLICEASNDVCISDAGSTYSQIGHRINLMGSNYQVMGVGSYKVGSGYVYSTQNFGSKSCQGTVPNTPIHHGSHTFNVTGSSVIYIVSYYSTTAATSAKIYIDGTGFDLTRLYGTATQGFYVYKPSTYTACQNYAFEFKTATATFKFPETGSLTTATKSNACTASWTSTNVFSGTSTTSSTGSPTSTSATSSSSTSTSATSSSPTSTSATSSSPTSTSATSSSSSSSTSTPSPTPNPSSSSSSSSSSSTGTGGSSTGGPVDEPNNATKTFSNIYLVLIFSIFGLIVF